MSHAESVDLDDPDTFPRPFGQYLLLENFARGGMGEVYLAKIGGIAGLERYCVLKKLRSELTRDREYVTRFIDEARVVVTLNHANICHVFDVGRVGEEYYLAMEYISGRDVRTTQDRSRQKERVMPPATALHLVCETLEALDYAHRRNHPLTGEPLNLVHRDVSPQNVLVSYEGEVKLIDFGLAASKLKVERTQPNVVMGKMAYMAPEQARGDQIDARADLFACGVLAYELLSGERFYEGMTANDIWQVAGKGGFVPRRWATIDHDLAKHLAKALHPDPKKRFATCGDFREALASHLHWRFPGTGVRGLREAMNELFADEVRKERELLAKFGTITVAGFRTSFEVSTSQSVSLARADEANAENARVVRNELAQVARNEQSASTSGAPMPSPAVVLTRTSGVRDVHKEATRLVANPGPAEGHAAAPSELTDPSAKGKGRSTDEADPSVTTRRPSSDSPPEMTMRLQRKGKTDDVTSIATELSLKPVTEEDEEPLVVPGAGRGKVAIAATLAVVAVVAVVFIARGGDERVERAPTEARVDAPVAPTASVPVAAVPAVPVAAVPVAAVPVAAVPVAAVPVAAVPVVPVAVAPDRPVTAPPPPVVEEMTPKAAAAVRAETKTETKTETRSETKIDAVDRAERKRIERERKKERELAAAAAEKPTEKVEKPVEKPKTPLSIPELLAVGARCAPCEQTYGIAAGATKDGPVINELRKCIEKRKCR